MWRGVDVEGEEGLPVRHSYRGHKVDIWRIAIGYKTTWLKQLKVKQSRQRESYPAKKGTMHLRPMNGRARGVRFSLEYYLFWPKRARCTCFWPAALIHTW